MKLFLCFRATGWIFVLSDWGFSVEGVPIEKQETLKTAKNSPKTHKIAKKLRVRLRISKKSSNFVARITNYNNRSSVAR